jgi:hypothetical protein
MDRKAPRGEGHLALLRHVYKKPRNP